MSLNKETKPNELLWDFEIQIYRLISARLPDLVIDNNNNNKKREPAE